MPEITFGTIVLNGEPFLRYNLKALYPFAHQIIIVEGATPGAERIASQEGHSTDSTLATLMDIKAHEDPENKLIIVTAEEEGHPNGFWPGEKHEMSQAYAKRATGNYLWQVDVDEFYKPDDMQTIVDILKQHPTITAVSFKMLTFWGGFDYLTDGWYLRRGANIYHRLFKWGKNYRYVTHRPPKVYDAQGRNLHGLQWINGHSLAQRGIYLYHYSLLFPKQVHEKCVYYSQSDWAKRTGAERWAQETFQKLQRPYRVHNVYDYPSWLERFHGTHPPQTELMRKNIETGQLKITVREIADIEYLLKSPFYKLGRIFLAVLEPIDRWVKVILHYLKNCLRRLI